MAIHPSFPTSPYEILDPDYRWFPADEALREASYEKLMPPLVSNIRREVKAWRDNGYEGASATSKALLSWWFHAEHVIPATGLSAGATQAGGTMAGFRYYFAQREAIETVIYLYEVTKVKDKFDLIRFDSSGAVSTGMFDEEWLRLVIKMATGSGKTKVMSLIITWCYFHKLYEEGSGLSTNFLVIAPNIIVLDRLRADFGGLKIFWNDPLLPDNGYEGQHWQDDFQITVHIQDDVSIIRKSGNISHYYPDFIVKVSDKDLFIVETKGLEDPDVPLKMARLKKWCEDINVSQKKLHFDFAFVDEEGFDRYKPDSFLSLVSNFRKYKDV